MSAPERDPADARVSSREALRFLTRAGRILSASLDLDETLQRLARLAVPRVACFAIIDLVQQDGRLERVAFRHVDAELERMLERPDPFLPDEAGLVPLARVMTTAEAVLIEDVARDWAWEGQGMERVRSVAGRSLMVVPMVAGDGTLGVLTFGSTRTDRFYQQQDLALARELARSASLAIENARLYRKAEQAIASRDEVLGVVSHDLRNPVNRVRLAAEMMTEMYQLPDGAHRSAAMIVRAADEMNRLIGDLLDVTQIEAGRLSIERRRTPLPDLLQRLEDAHEPAARGKGVAWEVARPTQPINVQIDEGRMLQALGNLVGNAIKFTPEGGTVRVVTEGTDERVRIGVQDTGPGMDEAQLAHVFDRFWQADGGDRRGAGLGLSIASGIIAAHEGRIHLESKPGVGTTAWVELPTSPAA
ncbi:MAG TPA: GAF domain-containing sensor histidine kinase [Longimicrobiales bacterium]|nr:GAF domain-containing sensor histidine kinase [Longimicrobiales bacterium]